jgi:FkbM family methyltransferase
MTAQISLPDASGMRRRPYNEATSNRELLALARTTFSNWMLPAALRRATSWISADWLLNIELGLRTRQGPQLKARVRDIGGPLDVFGLGAYDFNMIDWSRALYVVDAGAHIGSFTLFAASRGAGRIVAIEPNPETYALLVANVRLAGLADRVTTMNRAVADASGPRTLHSAKLSPASTILYGENDRDHAIPVEGITLREVLEATHWPRIDVMKIDIEGSEYDVFAAIEPDALDRVSVVLVECHHLPGFDPRQVAARLQDRGFAVAAEVAPNHTMLVASRNGVSIAPLT